jgi:hypothetical protein
MHEKLTEYLEKDRRLFILFFSFAFGVMTIVVGISCLTFCLLGLLATGIF